MAKGASCGPFLGSCGPRNGAVGRRGNCGRAVGHFVTGLWAGPRHCGPREGVKAVLTDVAIRNKQMTGKRSTPSQSLISETANL